MVKNIQVLTNRSIMVKKGQLLSKTVNYEQKRSITVNKMVNYSKKKNPVNYGC